MILAVVVSVTYCILGCAYNSFYHGRVGMDAIPNKDSWTSCTRYTRAGYVIHLHYVGDAILLFQLNISDGAQVRGDERISVLRTFSRRL